MKLLDYFRSNRDKSASVAKERLQILVAHERASRNAPSYLPQLQNEILAVIKKYVAIDQDAVSIQIDRDDHQDVLELNITLPEQHAGH
ncbi:MAG: cell division topological specificity factor MinE [Chromatiales bacterium]|jgi:cell division topological specificity factor